MWNGKCGYITWYSPCKCTSQCQGRVLIQNWVSGSRDRQSADPPPPPISPFTVHSNKKRIDISTWYLIITYVRYISYKWEIPFLMNGYRTQTAEVLERSVDTMMPSWRADTPGWWSPVASTCKLGLHKGDLRRL